MNGPTQLTVNIILDQSLRLDTLPWPVGQRDGAEPGQGWARGPKASSLSPGADFGQVFQPGRLAAKHSRFTSAIQTLTI